MIGKIQFQWGEPQTAILSDAGLWTCAVPEIQLMLRARFDPRLDFTPDKGNFGHWEVIEAARVLEGSYELTEVEPPDPEAVF